MRPEDATSPRNRIAEGSVRVIYTSPDGAWSIASMTFDDELRHGFRWNGDINDPDDKGNPRSHGQGTWTILPSEIGGPLAALAEVFQRSYTGARSAT
jgi:hypothetical protein